jgi:hypothetical protein
MEIPARRAKKMQIVAENVSHCWQKSMEEKQAGRADLTFHIILSFYSVKKLC